MSRRPDVTIAERILQALSRGPATLPAILPDTKPTSRYIAAGRMEAAGVIERVGLLPGNGYRGGMARVLWRRTGREAPARGYGCKYQPTRPAAAPVRKPRPPRPLRVLAAELARVRPPGSTVPGRVAVAFSAADAFAANEQRFQEVA